jgi:hypothetical protein
MKTIRNLAFMALAIGLVAQATRAALGPGNSIVASRVASSAAAPRPFPVQSASAHWNHYPAQSHLHPVANGAGQGDPWSGTSWEGYLSEPYHYSCGGKSAGCSQGGCDGNGCGCARAALNRLFGPCPLFRCRRCVSGCDCGAEESGCDDCVACDEPGWQQLPHNTIPDHGTDTHTDTDTQTDTGTDVSSPDAAADIDDQPDRGVDTGSDVGSSPDATPDTEANTDSNPVSEDLLEPMPLPPDNPKPVQPPRNPLPRNLLPKQADDALPKQVIGRLKIEISGTPVSFDKTESIETKETETKETSQPASTGTILRFRNGPTLSKPAPRTGGFEIQLLGLQSD